VNLQPDVLSILDRLAHRVWVFDIDRGRVHWANLAALELWRADSLEELTARDMAADMSYSVASRLRQYQADFERHEARFSETWTLYPKGEATTVRVLLSGYRLADGRMAMLCEALSDHAGEPDTLRSAEALLHTSVMITLYERGGGAALYRNPAARDTVADPTETCSSHLVSPEDRLRLFAELERDGHARQVVSVNTARGEAWHEISARACRDAVSGKEAWLFSEIDLSDLKRTEDRAHYLAHHDALTGLPNRSFVSRRFQERLDAVRTAGEEAALLFIDLDHFKHINDSLGHGVGDELLVHTARSIGGLLRDDDLLARLGGDEFLVLASAPDVRTYIERLARAVLDTVAEPVTVRGSLVNVTPSLGVCLFPEDGEDVETLLRHADLAMSRAKERGRNRFAYFSTELNEAAQLRRALESELRGALERKELVVYYQPRVRVSDGQVVGAEALVRWQHPRRGLVPPSVFIPVCEETRLIGAVGSFVLEEAAKQQRAWAEAGLDLRISVNLSPRQFEETELAEHLLAIVRSAGGNPDQLEFEITESLLLGNVAQTLATLQTLRAAGFAIAIDDFGTGYSSLAYLHRYPITCLKIDRSFMTQVDGSVAITELILTMTKMLKLDVVAEGVETEAQLSWLKERQCMDYQGFLFSPPLPVAEFEARIGWPPNGKRQ
jgi:diguanylate cyclase (GGDEF)-like protein